MKKIILCLLILTWGTYINAQKVEIIDNFSKTPIKEALVYCDDKYIGLTDEAGKLNISSKNCQNVFIFKDGYEELKTSFKDDQIIHLTPIKTALIEEVVIKRINIDDVISKVKTYFVRDHYTGARKENNLATFHAINSLRTDDKVLVYYNDIFHFINNGVFINSGFNNYSKNYRIVTEKNEKNPSLYGQRYYLFDNKYIFWKNFTCIANTITNEESLQNLLKNYKKYSTKITSDDDKIKIVFTSKDYYSELVIDSETGGIYEYYNKKSNFKENSPSYFDQKKQSYHIAYEDVRYIHFKEGDVFYQKSFSTSSKFQDEKKKITFSQQYSFNPKSYNPINVSKNLRKIDTCDLDYSDK